MANEAPKLVPPLDPMRPAPEELARLKAKFGELLHLKVGEYAILVRQFNEAEWDRFQTGVEKNGNRSLKDLLAGCVVWSNEPFETILAKRPAYGKKFGMGLIDWAGRGDELEKNEL